MRGGNKFLLNLFSGLSHKQIFFLIWFGVVGGFVALIWAYWKMTRSNFRRSEDAPAPYIRVDARRLPGNANTSGQVVVKDSKTTTPTRKS